MSNFDNDNSSNNGGTTATTWLDTSLLIFLILNVVFLVGTAIWFRVDHASNRRHRFNLLLPESLIDEVAWQYSLRSNLLLFGSALALYLLYIGELQFVLGIFVAFSVLNVVTDTLYQYQEATIFQKVKQGHRIAAIVIGSIALMYVILLKATAS